MKTLKGIFRLGPREWMRRRKDLKTLSHFERIREQTSLRSTLEKGK